MTTKATTKTTKKTTTKARTVPLDRYLGELWDQKGTDLLFTAGTPPLMRVDGSMTPIEGEPVMHPADTEAVIAAVLTKAQIADLGTNREIDFSFNWGDKARFRGNAFHQRRSQALALRIIPFEIPSFDELGLPPVVEKFVKLPRGLLLMTGPTGAGKSTTQASMIDWINQNRANHILTIEDPIEYVHPHKRSAVNQREVGTDSESFARALRSALREDPDVLLVGEMRDLESIQTTLTIAETGHLVFGTLHTNDTAQALDRIVDVFPAEQQAQIRVQLAASLAGVMYQQLIPTIGGGLVAAFEVLVATPAVRNLVREGKTQQLRNVVATNTREGMQTLETSLNQLVSSGVITYEDALARSLYPKEIAQRVRVPPLGETAGSPSSSA